MLLVVYSSGCSGQLAAELIAEPDRGSMVEAACGRAAKPPGHLACLKTKFHRSL